MKNKNDDKKKELYMITIKSLFDGNSDNFKRLVVWFVFL